MQGTCKALGEIDTATAPALSAHLRAQRSILVVVPAHNEERNLEHCIESILAQTRPADRIAVALDNCTDGTEELANKIRQRLKPDDRLPDLEVYKTINNVDTKAGALNLWVPKTCPGPLSRGFACAARMV